MTAMTCYGIDMGFLAVVAALSWDPMTLTAMPWHSHDDVMSRAYGRHKISSGFMTFVFGEHGISHCHAHKL